MFFHACMHYDLFVVVRPQSVMFESCVTRVPQLVPVVTCADSVRDACVCHFGLNIMSFVGLDCTVRSFCTLYAHFHVLQPLG